MDYSLRCCWEYILGSLSDATGFDAMRCILRCVDGVKTVEEVRGRDRRPTAPIFYSGIISPFVLES